MYTCMYLALMTMAHNVLQWHMLEMATTYTSISQLVYKLWYIYTVE